MNELAACRERIYQRDNVIRALRNIGAVDLEVRRGAGFGSSSRVVRVAHQGAGSGTYIGGDGRREDFYDSIPHQPPDA